MSRPGFFVDIEAETEDNTDYRRVLYTGKNTQLVVMCLKPKEEIGNEMHHDVDQFFRVESGRARFVLTKGSRNTSKTVSAGEAVIVPAGTHHNVINPSRTRKLKLYTLYSPPEHPSNTIQHTK